MRDTNLAQATTVSRFAEALHEAGPVAIQKQMQTHCEQVAEMQQRNARLTDDVRRLRRHVDFLKRLVGNDATLRNGASGLLRVEVLSWLLYERDDLVLEIDDHPVLLGDDTSSGVRKVAGFLVSLLCSDGPITEEMLGMVLRRKCNRYTDGGCGHADCSCGREPRPLDIPDSLIEAMLKCHIGRGAAAGLTADACCVCRHEQCNACKEAKRG